MKSRYIKKDKALFKKMNKCIGGFYSQLLSEKIKRGLRERKERVATNGK